MASVTATYTRTPKTLTRLKDLLKDLKAARKSGIALDREEHTLGICAVGAVVHDSFGAEMALTVPLPAQRFVGREDEIAQALMQTCAAVERDLGYSAD